MIFMSRYKKLLNSIKDAKNNKRKILLKNGIELDFREDKWNDVFRNRFGHDQSLYLEIGKYYLITRSFLTGNRKMELLKCDNKNMYLPEFTTHIMKLDVEPCKRY